ncbi:MAG TPA: beta-propeller domain-containing protein [Gemmatimonadaceae bacterium]|nr:beta-propeller domain-containing protein [Gemmatimonadaceae bacterium]
MNTRIVLVVSALTLIVPCTAAQVAGGGSSSLEAFRSDAELLSYLRGLAEARDRWLEAQRRAAQARRNCGSIRITRRGRRIPATDHVAAVVRGRVVSGDGSPVAGATVAIDSLEVNATTTDEGVFTLRPAPRRLTKRRDWSITVRRLGYVAQSGTIRVGPRDSVAVAVNLCDAGLALQEVQVSAADAYETRRSESITNTQHADVDEGGIVKAHGDHLVILRRGRLFTVRLGDELRPVSTINAFGPGIDPRGTWYDEMLISGDKIIVIGYSYESDGTEIGIFGINGAGELRHLSTYHLRSNDYYSSRNYASRLLGTKLVFYTPHYLWYGSKDPLEMLPAIRKWRARGRQGAFRRIVAATRVYRPVVEPPPYDAALHTVTTCDLATPELECEATAVIGGSGRVFYVSASAVYTWLSEWRSRESTDSAAAVVYRMALNGSSPTALRVTGSPIDQFSFLESDDGYLNVLVREGAHGDAMWEPEWTAGPVALLRVSLESFGSGRRRASPSSYRRLPVPTGSVFVNRFVGDHLLYGTGNGWSRPATERSVLYVVPWKGKGVSAITLAHGTDRIEAMGGHAVVIGTDGRDLHFTGVRLGGRPQIDLRYSMANAAQGELRSHGFFYKPDTPDSGVLGLPIRGGGEAGYEHLWKSSASVLFLKKDHRGLAELGTLIAADTAEVDDGCVASCVDWYGNARPIFIRERVFALLGYELVEGRVDTDRIRETRRVSFAPSGVRAVGH